MIEIGLHGSPSSIVGLMPTMYSYKIDENRPIAYKLDEFNMDLDDL